MGRLFAPKAKTEAAPVAPTPPASPTMTQDQIKELVAGAVGGVANQLSDTVNRLGLKIEELASRQPQVVVQQPHVAAHVAPEITDADIDSAVLSGQGAAARIRALIDRQVNNATQRVINEHVNPMRDYGVNTIGELSRRITTGGMKYYKRYEKEIDARLATLTPDVRANPIVIETIYNAVVGTHADELTREAGEAAVRQAQEGTGTPTPGKSGAATPGTGAGSNVNREGDDQVPDVATFVQGQGFSPHDALAALQHKGQGGQDSDAFARSLGYKDWSSYMKQYDELLASDTSGNA